MGRLPKVIPHADGSCSVRVTIPRALFLVTQAHAERFGLRIDVSLSMLFTELAAAVASRKASAFLSATWIEAMRKVNVDNFGVLEEGPPIDLSKLHRSAKTKSGFVGVYANGKGFRAAARVPNGGGSAEKHLGTFDTAEEAAWRRYLYYKEHKLPYGELEVEVDAWRKRGETGTDEELVREILDHARQVGTIHIFEPWLTTGSVSDLRDTTAPMVESSPAAEPPMLGFEDGVSPFEILRQREAAIRSRTAPAAVPRGPRLARCGACGSEREIDDFMRAHMQFQARPNEPMDVFYCGCQHDPEDE